MTTLRMTPARLALLRAVADPNVTVFQFLDTDLGRLRSVWIQPDFTERMVTRPADDLVKAGLVEVGDLSYVSPRVAARRYGVSEEGRRVLAEPDTREHQ